MLLTDRYHDRLAGVLSCYDRIVITGTLPGACFSEGMTKILKARGIRVFDYAAQFAAPLRERVREAAAAVAAAAGITIEHIAKSYIHKEDVVAKVLAARGSHPGLVHVISAMEACDGYQPWHDTRAGLFAGADVVSVSLAVLLQRPQLAGVQAQRRRHRLRHGRQRLCQDCRLAARASPGRRAVPAGFAPRPACLAGNVLMAVQDHLGRKGGMTADLDGEMAPLWIEDMKRVVVDIRHRLLAFDVVLALISHTGACARPTRTRNKPWVTVVLARYSSARSCLRWPAEQSITGMPCALA
jgi:hypothetical protein